jgi:Rrf2 family protein
MKYSTKLSDAVHIMAFIEINHDFDLSSTAIATSIQTNPAFVRQIMMKLRKAGLMSSVTGHAKPSLAKPAEQITLLEIYKAVEGDKPLLHLDTHTNPECGVGVNIQLALLDYYQEIQKMAEEHMNQISLQDIIKSYSQKADSFSE